MKESTAKSIVRDVSFPVVWLRQQCAYYYHLWLGKHHPQKLASKRYKDAMGKELDWDSPKDLNEKINWMKFNTDLSEWTRLSDKYRVREYLKERNREDLLVKLYGVWDNADDIDFDALPNQFVLKSNHGCGTVILVKDKNSIDKLTVRKQMLLRRPPGASSAPSGCPDPSTSRWVCVWGAGLLREKGGRDAALQDRSDAGLKQDQYPVRWLRQSFAVSYVL